MSDKLNENLNPEEQVNSEDTEVLEPPKPKLEESDDWKFDGEAPMLDGAVVENDEYEIVIPGNDEPAKSEDEKLKNKEQQLTAEELEKKKTMRAVVIFIIAVAALAIIGVAVFFGIRFFSQPNTEEKMNPGNVAMKIDDTKISIGMYNYYYNSTVNYYLQQASYGNVELDGTKAYTTQKTTNEDGEEITWEQRFKDDTVAQLKRLVAYYQAAVKEGMELDEEQKKLIEEDLQKIKDTASNDDVSVDEYTGVNFGEYCGIATVEKMENMSYLAQTYLRKASIETVPDEERINKYYEEHKEDYQQVEMCYLVMQYTTETKTDVIKKAKKYAAQISNENQLKKLIPVVCKDLIDAYVQQGTYGDADAVAEQIASSSTMKVTKSNPNQLPQAIIDFLFSKDKKKGDCRTVADDDYQAVFIVLKNSEIGLAEDEVYSVRHILIMPETDKADDDDDTETAEPTEQQWQAAKEKANEVLSEYNAGERTEYSFALLAEKYSGDEGSLSANGAGSGFGGLYANT
nr:hypothetical protein [Eubacterium sp.]